MTREDIAVRFRLLVVIATLAAGLATPLPAHHSLAEYDPNTLIKFSGTIAEIKWVNPHSWITLTVRNPDGSTFTANIEVAGIAALLAFGGLTQLQVRHPVKNLHVRETERARREEHHGTQPVSVIRRPIKRCPRVCLR